MYKIKSVFFRKALILQRFYYPPKVRRGKYWGLVVFLLQYFPPSRYENYCIIMQRGVLRDINIVG